MFGLSPYLLIGTLLGGAALFIGGYIEGDGDAASRYKVTIKQMQIDAAEAAQKAAQDMLIKSSNASQALEVKNAKASVVYRTITEMVDKIVERPIYRSACFDDAGLRLANAALGGVAAEASAAVEPNSAMPAAIISR